VLKHRFQLFIFPSPRGADGHICVDLIARIDSLVDFNEVNTRLTFVWGHVSTRDQVCWGRIGDASKNGRMRLVAQVQILLVGGDQSGTQYCPRDVIDVRVV
jgi:hypothetical protein